MAHRALHNTISTLHLPPLVTWPRLVYRGTHFSFKNGPGADGFLALTIDDGLCRQAKDKSMATEVCDLLQQHQATATFFLVRDHIRDMDDELRRLVADGHELGNHGLQDAPMSRLGESEFEAQLLEGNRSLEAFLPASERMQWFRAPCGMFNSTMHGVIERNDMTHVLGDCYCDDYAVEDSVWVASTLLAQVQAGSIVIMHMPERGHWEHTFEALRLVLEGLEQKGLRAVTLSQMVQRIRVSQVQEPSPQEPSPRGSWWVCRHLDFPRETRPEHKIRGRSYASRVKAETAYRSSTRFQACVLLSPTFDIVRSYGFNGGRFDAMVAWARSSAQVKE